MSVWPTCLRQVSSAFSVTPASPYSAAATFPGALGHSCPAYRLRQLFSALSVAGAQPSRLRQLFSATATFLDVPGHSCPAHRLRQLFSAPSVTPCPAHPAAATSLGPSVTPCPALRLGQLFSAPSIKPAQPHPAAAAFLGPSAHADLACLAKADFPTHLPVTADFPAHVFHT